MGSIVLSWLSKILVGLFFLGLVGSAVVVVITFFEDGKLLLEGDEPANRPAESIPKNAREAF
jgi:hypothetical protein